MQKEHTATRGDHGLYLRYREIHNHGDYSVGAFVADDDDELAHATAIMTATSRMIDSVQQGVSEQRCPNPLDS